MALADASHSTTPPGQQVSITFNPAKAERLFEGSGHTLAEMLKIADEGKALPHFPLPTSVRATVAVDSADRWSRRTSSAWCGAAIPRWPTSTWC